VSWSTLHSRESRLACTQVLHDFRGSSIYYKAYICQVFNLLKKYFLVYYYKDMMAKPLFLDIILSDVGTNHGLIKYII
jgi:hypothetical protein